ncbi:hypothetical protein IP68_13730 [Blastomonas sp. AAP25]|uniref:hypothetical protein n=1 Tax=Blastomonas sp. AAP25 TaxID=1523416 RepID=UPI0006B94740|nr:hypothetical protein [Blastomonas sp. AAP25]KPF74088.1 hypothetical protein IP68_13730 [Blastomonas sp. AAP25]
MNKIAELVERMKAIPDKETRAAQLEGMKAVRDKVRAAADAADRLRVRTVALAAIMDVDFVDKGTLSLTQASQSATTLKKRYDQGLGFDLKRADAALIQINERLDQGSSAVDKGWRALIDDQVRRFKPLAEAAERAMLPGASSLRNAIGVVEGWRDRPPVNRQAAHLYSEHAAQMPASIAKLGLEGRAGKFMVDASNGRAKARDLQDADVLAFLEAYPAVWAMLKVSL